jgi:hypothetical protein
MTVQTYVVLALNQDNPETVASALSWIVLSMQCLPLDFDEKNLGLPLCIDELMEHYTANVERLVIHDDELSLSIEGIDTILVQAQLYANMGRATQGMDHAAQGTIARAYAWPASDLGARYRNMPCASTALRGCLVVLGRVRLLPQLTHGPTKFCCWGYLQFWKIPEKG